MLARMSFDASSLFASFVIGTVGLALLIYGKKQLRLPHFAVGLAMLIYPYFIPSAGVMVGIAAALVGLLALLVKLGV